jgi:hypothetical protein
LRSIRHRLVPFSEERKNFSQPERRSLVFDGGKGQSWGRASENEAKRAKQRPKNPLGAVGMLAWTWLLLGLLRRWKAAISSTLDFPGFHLSI